MRCIQVKILDSSTPGQQALGDSISASSGLCWGVYVENAQEAKWENNLDVQSFFCVCFCFCVFCGFWSKIDFASALALRKTDDSSCPGMVGMHAFGYVGNKPRQAALPTFPAFGKRFTVKLEAIS